MPSLFLHQKVYFILYTARFKEKKMKTRFVRYYDFVYIFSLRRHFPVHALQFNVDF